jgi:2-polyprenyl-3-methyl-5-hydroxy-6-metoxy-1,4-benzoquinol methylase
MSAITRARAAKWIRGQGIEIGALNAPLLVRDGVDVRYVDRAPIEVLRDHYRELGAQPLVSPSIIGHANDLSALSDDSVDFVIANHLLEHLEDPIGGLQEMLRVIRPGGTLFMALPDPRVTFDVDRALTTAEHVVDEFRNGTQRTRQSHFEDWVAKAEPHVEWMQQAGVGTGPMRVRELMEMDYSIHFHVWRPDTFLVLIVAAMTEAHLELELVDFKPRLLHDTEYIFVFSKGTAGLALDPSLLELKGIDDLSAELAAITSSHSWRLTSPLRMAGKVARGLSHGARRSRRSGDAQPPAASKGGPQS